jgi:hypothetical protein
MAFPYNPTPVGDFSMSSPDTSAPDHPLRPEDRAFYTKALWASLLKPNGTRSDLIDLGMEVLAKTPLSKIDEKKFARLLPYLSQASEAFALQVRTKLMSEFEAFIQTQEDTYEARISALEAELKDLRTLPPSEKKTSETPATPPFEISNG